MSDDLPGARRVPLVTRLDPAHPAYEHVLAMHEQAVAADVPTYPDPLSGFEVLTAAELWARGFCCDSGCRHCPFVEGPRGPDHLVPPALPDDG
ncbi:MAG: DUF5522 domain-containing protein [Nitriliruptoraceae bacterium]